MSGTAELDSIDGVPLSHRRVQLSEVGLHVVEAGSGDKLVLLLHGFPEFWFSWRAQIPALVKAGFRVVAPDLRGYNTSDKPPGVASYDVEKLAGDVADLVKALGAERAHVVGHDWGGAVAWAFAMLHGDRLRRLSILNAPHPVHYQELVRRDLGQVVRSWYVFFFQIPALPEWMIRAGDFRSVARAFRGLVMRGRLSEEDVRRYAEALGQPGALTAAVNYYRAAVRRLFSGLPPFQPVEAETQVIWGQRDHFLKQELAEPPEKWVPKLRVDRVEGANHFVQMDAPDKVNPLLIEHLSAG
ncbi:MAG TPA: alpha/beta fold hydrolase [Myxococcales bacterium]|nr:alpha/beta fold hydrolase [Myxococcales bacterium]